MDIKVVLAENAGFCFGVKRAVDEAIKTQKQYDKKIYTLGPLIHNNDAVKYLEENHVYAIDFKDINSLSENDVILIRSHGVKASVIAELKNKGLVVVNATCPYVTNIQQKAKIYYEKGYKIIIIGDENHPEVIGINGWCNDEAIIVNGKNIPESFPKKVCVLCQTTEKKETWNKVLNSITNCSKEIVAFNTICSATDVRQKSAQELSLKADKIIIVGGKNSSNTTKLYEICKENCCKSYHIENSEELTEELLNNEGLTVGITAGASTPDWVINSVINKIENK